jgi:hypothetical protein
MNRRRFMQLSAATVAATALSLSAQTAVPWTTRAHDNQRSGWNNQETLLSQANVAAKGIVRKTIIPVIGDARGMESQPLVLPAVTTAQGVKDVMVLPSMANVVRGVDAHTGAGIWQVTLGTPITGSPAIDSHSINPHYGCLSTGVIDPDLKRLYQVCWLSPDGTGNPKTGLYSMFVLNVADGSQVVPAVMVQGTDTTMWKQRSSLVETNVNGVKTVFFAHGSIYEFGPNADSHPGGITAFDVATNTVSAQLPMTSGIWMAGQGMAADAQGYMYLITANGAFDGISQWGESFLRVKYANKTLSVVDNWTPWTDLQRDVVPVTAKLAGTSAPSMRPVGASAQRTVTGAWTDEDWGSAGPACLFQVGVCIAAGKDGIAYEIKAANMGQTRPADLANPKTNCAKLAAPPVFLTMDPGPVDPCPANPATLNFFPWGNTAHLHMTPVQMYDPVLKSWTIFVWGENNQLHKWAVSSTGALTYIAQSHEFASIDVMGTPPGGMPGGECSGSSNGGDANTALLACSIPLGDANSAIVGGRFIVYDPIHLAADGYLKVLWDSQRWGITYLFNKFDPPLIDAGEILIPNYNGGVDVYGLTN